MFGKFDVRGTQIHLNLLKLMIERFMSTKNLIVVFILGLLFANCGSDTKAGKGSAKVVEEINVDSKNSVADIIRNPVSADGPMDTVNVAKMTFEEMTYNFGKVKEGKVINHVFKFTNSGKVPLVITHAKSTCGCTVPKWPEEPIDPGKTGEINVKFDTKGKKSFQDKPVTITSNTYPAQTVLHLKGHVTPKE